MSLEVYAKVGTHSKNKIRIKYKRKPPIEKEFIEFKEYPFERYAKWKKGYIWQITDDIGGKLFWVELF